MKAVKIDNSLIKPEEKEIVEDLIVTAHGDARRKAEALMQEKMQGLTGGMPLPPGLKLFRQPSTIHVFPAADSRRGWPGQARP